MVCSSQTDVICARYIQITPLPYFNTCWSVTVFHNSALLVDVGSFLVLTPKSVWYTGCLTQNMRLLLYTADYTPIYLQREYLFYFLYFTTCQCVSSKSEQIRLYRFVSSGKQINPRLGRTQDQGAPQIRVQPRFAYSLDLGSAQIWVQPRCGYSLDHGEAQYGKEPIYQIDNSSYMI